MATHVNFAFVLLWKPRAKLDPVIAREVYSRHRDRIAIKRVTAMFVSRGGDLIGACR